MSLLTRNQDVQLRGVLLLLAFLLSTSQRAAALHAPSSIRPLSTDHATSSPLHTAHGNDHTHQIVSAHHPDSPVQLVGTDALQPSQRKCVIMTVLYSDDFTMGAHVLGHALKRHGTKSGMYIMITTNVSQWARDKLTEVGWKVSFFF
jgi:hypothetical protein